MRERNERLRECMWKNVGDLCMIEWNIGVRVDRNVFLLGRRIGKVWGIIVLLKQGSSK